MAKDENPFSEYFGQNERIIVVLSLFCGFLFTSITLLLTTLENRGGILGQATILFLTLVFYFSLYTLLDNLEMAFHHQKYSTLNAENSPLLQLATDFLSLRNLNHFHVSTIRPELSSNNLWNHLGNTRGSKHQHNRQAFLQTSQHEILEKET